MSQPFTVALPSRDFPGDHHWTKPYNRTEYDEAALYKLFLQRGLRVMIYSGDTDACIPYRWVPCPSGDVCC